MKNKSLILIITDQTLVGDVRVNTIPSDFKDALCEFINIKDYSNRLPLSKYDLFKFTLFILSNLLSFRFVKSYLNYKSILKKEKIPRPFFWLGIKPLFKEMLIMFKYYKSFTNQAYELIYANDLIAGLVAYQLKRKAGIDYIYDSHEVSAFRARNSGVFRSVFEITLESKVVELASKTYTVNNPIRRLYDSLYGKRVNVRNNNFYQNNFLNFDSAKDVAVVYVGAYNKHRNIDELIKLSKKHKVFIFFSNSHPYQNIVMNNIEINSIDEYVTKIKKISLDYNLTMWCSFSKDILSYRLSLPNKFFQSLAFGMPIIVSQDTYMFELVCKYSIGMSYSELIAMKKADLRQNILEFSKNCIDLKKKIDCFEIEL